MGISEIYPRTEGSAADPGAVCGDYEILGKRRKSIYAQSYGIFSAFDKRDGSQAVGEVWSEPDPIIIWDTYTGRRKLLAFSFFYDIV